MMNNGGQYSQPQVSQQYNQLLQQPQQSTQQGMQQFLQPQGMFMPQQPQAQPSTQIPQTPQATPQVMSQNQNSPFMAAFMQMMQQQAAQSQQQPQTANPQRPLPYGLVMGPRGQLMLPQRGAQTQAPVTPQTPTPTAQYQAPSNLLQQFSAPINNAPTAGQKNA